MRWHARAVAAPSPPPLGGLDAVARNKAEDLLRGGGGGVGPGAPTQHKPDAFGVVQLGVAQPVGLQRLGEELEALDRVCPPAAPARQSCLGVGVGEALLAQAALGLVPASAVPEALWAAEVAAAEGAQSLGIGGKALAPGKLEFQSTATYLLSYPPPVAL